MLTLSSTTDKIQVILETSAATSNMTCYVAYRDTTTSSITPINYQVSTNGTSAIDLVSPPTSSTQRLVEYLSVYNGDTQSDVVTVRFSDNGTFYTLFKSRLAPSDKLEYKDKSGFSIVSKSGSIKKSQTSLGTSNTSQSISILPNDVNFSSTVSNSIKNPSEVGLGFPVAKGGLYYFRIIGFFDSSSTTNGAKINLAYPSIGPNLSGYYIWIGATTSTWGVSYAQTSSFVPALSQSTSPATSSNPFIFDGFVSATDNGFASFSFGSEDVAPSSITLKANNRLFYHRVI